MKTRIVIKIGGEQVAVTVPIELTRLIQLGGVSIERLHNPDHTAYVPFELVRLESV